VSLPQELRDQLERLFGLRHDFGGVDAEQPPLRCRGLGEPYLKAATGKVIQGGGPLSGPHRVVDRAGRQHGGVAEADAARALGYRREYDLRRRGQAELLPAVVLHLPPATIAKLVGQLRLLDGLLESLVLVALGPRTRILNLIEEIDFHLF